MGFILETIFISQSNPDSCTTISDSAFSECNSLQAIAIPDSCTTIGDSAFFGCKKITSVSIPANCTSVGDNAFDCGVNNVALERVDFQGGCNPKIGDCAFGSTWSFWHDKTLFLYGSSDCTNAEQYASDRRNEGCPVKFQVYSKKLEINNEAGKQYYIYDKYNSESLDTTGIQITATDEKDVKVAVDPANCEISELDSKTLGPQEITVNYGGASATFTVYVCCDLSSDRANIAVNQVSYTGECVEPDVTIKVGNTTLQYEKEDSEAEVYNGNEREPKIKVTFNGKEVEERQYSVDYSYNTYASEQAKVKITARVDSNFSDYKEQVFTIHPLDLMSKDANTKVDVSTAKYTGSKVKPDSVQVTCSIGGSGKDTVLTEGTDYEISYSNNEDVGTADYIITGKGNYCGEYKGTYEIEKRPISDTDFVTVVLNDVEYSGQAQMPKPTVTFKSAASGKPVTLEEGVDYEIASIKLKTEEVQTEVEAPVEIGSYIVTIEGKGEHFSGSVEVKYAITGVPLWEKGAANNAEIAPIDNQVYKANGCRPQITVTKGDKVLTEGTDYAVSYINNNAVGKDTASVVITGKGKYTGTMQKAFTIVAAPLYVEGASDNAVIAPIGDQTYVQSGCKPKTTVTKDGTTLVEGTDYYLQYKNNNGVGEATVYVVGMGNYTGTIQENFVIVGTAGDPVNPTTQATSASTTEASATTQATSASTTEASATTQATSASTTTQEASTSATTQAISASSEAKKPGKVKIVSSKNGKTVVLKWKQIKGVKSYQITYSLKKNFKAKKNISTTKTSYTFTTKKLKKGKTYFVKVRAKNAKGYGTYSVVKKIKIK